MTVSALTRVDDWRGRFEATIDEIMRVPFAWADQTDCAIHLAGRLVEALTGVDCVAQYRGRYTTSAGAVRVMRNDGFANLGDLVAAILPELEHPSRAEVGDIAAIPDDGPFGFALGVVNGERIFVLTEKGVGTVDLLAATRAFKVG